MRPKMRQGTAQNFLQYAEPKFGNIAALLVKQPAKQRVKPYVKQRHFKRPGLSTIEELEEPGAESESEPESETESDGIPSGPPSYVGPPTYNTGSGELPTYESVPPKLRNVIEAAYRAQRLQEERRRNPTTIPNSSRPRSSSGSNRSDREARRGRDFWRHFLAPALSMGAYVIVCVLLVVL